jgi:hypothetical protein
MTTKRLNAYERDPKIVNETIRSLQVLDDNISAGGRGVMTDSVEGSWTPDLKFGGANTDIVGTQTGRYVRVGNQVTLWATIVLTNNGSASGSATITGAPYTSSNVSGLVYVGTLGNYINLADLANYHCTIAANSSTINLRAHTAASDDSAAITETSIDNDAEFSICITYRTG